MESSGADRLRGRGGSWARAAQCGRRMYYLLHGACGRGREGEFLSAHSAGRSVLSGYNWALWPSECVAKEHGVAQDCVLEGSDGD